MAISSEVMAAGWALLQERYSRDFSAPMKRLYRRLLEQHGITDGEFERAVEAVIYRGRFFPTPEQLVEAVRGTVEQKAAEDWERALSRDWRALTSEGRAALRAIGDPELQMIPTADVVWLRREFIRAYGTAPPAPQLEYRITADGRRVIDRAMAGRLEAV